MARVGSCAGRTQQQQQHTLIDTWRGSGEECIGPPCAANTTQPWLRRRKTRVVERATQRRQTVDDRAARSKIGACERRGETSYAGEAPATGSGGTGNQRGDRRGWAHSLATQVAVRVAFPSAGRWGHATGCWGLLRERLARCRRSPLAAIAPLRSLSSRSSRTVILRPSSSASCSVSIAETASSDVSNSTMPHPLERPVSSSVMTDA
mmetsp:Transcript_14866/g.59594  ORF Transcript_14866/g.59594 Transcript_14866/m.59594 type:complete len:207 (+) Transcript_14866:75-695(+)